MPIINGKTYPLNLEFDKWLFENAAYSNVSGDAYLLAQQVFEYFKPESKDE